MVYTVTAVDATGSESLPAEYLFADTMTNFTQVEGSALIAWTGVTDAVEYYIYRSVVMTDDTDLSGSQEVGFIGRCRGTQFVDANIISDFTKTPPLNHDPYADLKVTYVEMTAAGTGYDNTTTVAITGAPGSGFIGYPTVSNAGLITGVVILSGGQDFVTPVVAFTGPGSGATATAWLNASTNNNPRAFKVFQQRGVYAGTRNNPMQIEGSKPLDLDNNDAGTLINAGDAYSYVLDVPSAIPIRHLITLKSGLLAFTDISIEQLRAEEGKAISPLNAVAETQVYKGASLTEPIKVGLEILFCQNILGNLYSMTLTQYSNNYTIQDLTVLSSHLFHKGNEIQQMTYSEEPHKLIYCVREDGSRLVFTYLREQEVFAWTRDLTKGRYEESTAIIEGDESVIYQSVERTLANGTHKYIERVASRYFENDEDYWGVDCGLDYAQNYLDESITPAAATGTGITFTLSGTPTDIAVGDILYVGGGKAEVTVLPGGSALTCDWLRDMTDLQAQDDSDLPNTIASGNWSWATPVLEVTGLDHLEGEEVSILADGNAHLGLTVTNGTVTLPNELAASKIIIGIPYTSRLRTLSVTTSNVLVEGKLKSVAGAAVRRYETRGLTIGSSFADADQYTMKDRTAEQWGEPINLHTEIDMEWISGGWDREGYVYFQQKYPLPATILGYVLSAELGDM